MSERNQMYYTKTTRAMLRAVNEVGAKPFVLFQYYQTYQNAKDGIFPALNRVADDLGMTSSAVCNLRNRLEKAGWIKVEKGRVLIIKTFTKNESDSQKMKEDSHFVNTDSQKMNQDSQNVNEKPPEANKTQGETEIPLNNEYKTTSNNNENKELVRRAGLKKEIETVFEFWQITHGHPQAHLTTLREKKIRERLGSGYSVDDLKRAIQGCKVSPHHQGQNDRKQIYDDLELILRDDTQLEKMIGYNRKPKGEINGKRTSNSAVLNEWADFIQS